MVKKKLKKYLLLECLFYLHITNLLKIFNIRGHHEHRNQNYTEISSHRNQNNCCGENKKHNDKMHGERNP